MLYLQQIQGRYQRGTGRKYQSGEVGSKQGSQRRKDTDRTAPLLPTVDNVISEGMNEEIDYMTNKLMMQGKSINFTRLGLEQVILSRLER